MLFAFLPSVTDMAFVSVVAIMLFGKRLPEVARQVGRGWAELKKGLTSLQSEFNAALYSDVPSSSSRQSAAYSSSEIDDYEEQTAPKFVPPPSEPAVDTSRSSAPHSPAA